MKATDKNQCISHVMIIKMKKEVSENTCHSYSLSLLSARDQAAHHGIVLPALALPMMNTHWQVFSKKTKVTQKSCRLRKIGKRDPELNPIHIKA